MASVLKISDAASLALHTACFMAPDEARIRTTREIASALGVSEAHLSKVLQRLARAGIVESLRGPRGGFRLARPPATLTLEDVFEAIEGPMETPGCLLGTPVCGGACMLGTLLSDLDRQVRDHFSSTRISDLASAFGRLHETQTADHRN
jgi:Rrf2 family protein